MAITADPKIVVEQDEKGGAKLRSSLAETEKIQRKLANAIKDANFKAAYNEAAKASDELREAQERLAKTAEKNKVESKGGVGQALAMGGAFGIAANQALELGRKMASLAVDTYEFARAGANAADIAGRFDALGSAVPSIEALSTALMGTVDETTMQRFATLNAEIGLSAEESENAARSIAILAANAGRASETGDFLMKAAKGQVEGLRELNFVVDINSESFRGLTEAQKKAQIQRELAASATRLEAGGVETSSLAYAQAATSVADLVSNLQVMANEMLLDSGAMSEFSAVIAKVQEYLAENKDDVAALASGLASLAGFVGGRLIGVLESAADRFALVMKVVGPLVDITGFLVDGFGDLYEEAKQAALGLIGLGDAGEEASKIFDGVKASLAGFREQARLAKESAEQHAAAMEAAIKPAADMKAKLVELIETGQDLNGTLDGRGILLYRDAIELLTEELDFAASEFEFAALNAESLRLELESGTYKRGSEAFKRVYDERLETIAKANAAENEMREKQRLVSAARAGLERELYEREAEARAKAAQNEEALASKRAKNAADSAKNRAEQVEIFNRSMGASVDFLHGRYESFFDAIERRGLQWQKNLKDAEQNRLDLAQEIREQQMRYAENMYKAEAQLAADNWKSQKQLIGETIQSMGGMAAEYLGGGWARAGFEAAFQIGMGSAELATPPFFGANRFLAAGQLLASQAFAEANGAKGGSSGGAARATAAPAAGNAMLRRPDSAQNGAVSGAVTQIWFRDRMLGEAVAQDLGQVSRFGGRKVPVSAVGGGNRRGMD